MKKLADVNAKNLIKLADKWFSLYIRLRDADMNGYCTCCTCGRVKKWNDEIDCGHYSKRNLAHRYNEQNCAAQCRYCNNFLKGEADKHSWYIDKKYGSGTAELLRGTEHKIRKMDRISLTALIEDYKQKAKKEAKKRGIEL